jgi:hypothetical protein
VRGEADALPPPGWAEADGEALRRALEAAGPSELPGPSFGDYLLDLGAWVRDLLLDAVGRALPAADWSLAERVALYGVVGAAVVATLAVLAFAVRRLRQRRALPVAAAAVAPPLPEATADAAWWGSELARRLEGGALRAALEALWWWVARRLDPPGLDPSWTTGELLGRSAGAGSLREPLRRLERLQWGTAEPRRSDVEALVRTLREALP